MNTDGVTAPQQDDVRLCAAVSGDVQGVGFRAWTRREAQRLDLRGSATNLPDGRVEVVVEGSRPAVQALLDVLHGDTPGTVTAVETAWSAATGAAGFSIG